MIGTSLSHYRILEKIGEGGMGVVYKAHDTHLDRLVSIKVLPPGRIADPERKRRFVQEAKAASALNHPNIVHVYDIDAAEGVDFIAMEFVDGKTLDELIGRKGLKLSDALRFAVQIADALAAAHAAGIVHRDIKPSNIMVSQKGLVKILDFGLAKLAERAEDDLSAPTQTTRPRTEDGAVVGTVAYMSPEQAEGRKVDVRSDIFSFGSVLYEMVTGRRAFQGDTNISTLSAILHKEPPPISQISANTPSELERIIVRCLRKDPARRAQHIVDVRLALEEVKEESESGLQSRTLAAQPHSWRRWALGALLVVVPIAGFFVWQAGRPTQPEGPLRAVALTTFPGIESYPSLSPDGSNVAFMWSPINRKADGLRILATRFRGRGMPTSRYDVWMPSLGPSERLLRAVQAGRISWAEFANAYRAELFMDGPIDSRSRTIKNHGQKFTLRLIKRLADSGHVTLLCHCSEDQDRCHRYVLRKLILSDRV